MSMEGTHTAYTMLKTVLARLFLPRPRGLIQSPEAFCSEFCAKSFRPPYFSFMMWLWNLPAFLVIARCREWGLFLKLLTLLFRFYFSIMGKRQRKRCWTHFCSVHVEVTWPHVPLFNIISKKISNCWGRPNHHHRNRDCRQDIVIRGQEELNRRRGRGRRRRTTWLSNLQGR